MLVPSPVEAKTIEVVSCTFSSPFPTAIPRPLLIVIRAEGQDPTKEELLAWFDGKIAKWWLPDDVVFVDEIPHTATGKIKKIELRKQFADYQLPDA